MRAAARPTLIALVTAFLVLVGAPAFAQDALDDVLGPLSWGATEQDVLDAERERILDAYRLSIAGEQDPLVIDRQRREADEEFASIRDARVVFDGERTGFEVSVLRGEVLAGVGQSLIPVRDELVLRYFVFENGVLRRIVVTYDQADLGYIHFEPFYERLMPLFGDPEDTEWREDEIGVQHLVRARWAGERTRLRVEDRTEMFASFVLVYDDASWTPPTSTAAERPAGRDGGGRSAIGSIMNRIEAEGSGATANDDVVDQLIGAPTTVELRIRVDEDDIVGEGSGEATADAEAAEVEEPRERERSRSSEREEEEEDDGGEIVY